MRAETQARETALRYVYRCDARDELCCNADDYHHFMHHFREQVDDDFCEKLCLGTLKNVEEIDKLIEAYAANWKLPRMARTDRALLRVGTYELTALTTPFKVVMQTLTSILVLIAHIINAWNLVASFPGTGEHIVCVYVHNYSKGHVVELEACMTINSSRG